jgi:hypothetical protein
VGYERKSMQILGGGFSMLPPGDKVPVTDYLLAQNWRSDALGKLHSRAGYPQQFSIPGAGIAHSASDSGGAMSAYYVACNSAIANPAGSVYYNSNPAPIATGFDGRRVAFAAMNGFEWIMNRGRQGRHSAAAGWETWTLSAPPASPTAAAAVSGGVVASVVYAYAATGNPAYVHSLTIAGVVYSFVENGYSAAQIPLVIASLASQDPNCSVTYPGSGPNVTIAPIAANVLIPVSGSDGNPDTNLGTGIITSLPNGTYQYYITFQSTDLSLESNPSPASAAVTVAGQPVQVTIPAADAPKDPRIGFVNIYRTGGNLGQAYRVGQVTSTVAAPATGFLDTIPDLQATENGVVMPVDNDPPPAAAGMIGPHYSRLLAWSTALHKNRLFWTPVDLPQYWPGASDEQEGNWVDVGLDDEEILWCSIHGNLTVIYKERSIWVLIGDPDTGSLGQSYEGLGLANAFALAPAGEIDYFVGPNGLYLFDMDKVQAIAGNLLPLFNQSIVNGGALTRPGSVLPGSANNSTSTAPYAIALGHALGRLYVAYAENAAAAQWNLLVFDEGPLPEIQASLYAGKSGRWFYNRTAAPGATGFFGFFFDGTSMLGLTGSPGGTAIALSVSDFRNFQKTDNGAALECVYQSHYEDAGLPDNDKVWLEVAIDYEFEAGVAANVTARFNTGALPAIALGALAAGPRTTVSFRLSPDDIADPDAQDGVLAKNMAVVIDATATGSAVIHNVYLYYYPEERLAVMASTLPTDLGVAKDKEAKELQLDILATSVASVAVRSDLPGNALALRHSFAIAPHGGRAALKFPFDVTEGYIWQVAISGGPFRLYSARLLMRQIGIAVEGYESEAGFRWDSMETPLADGDVVTVDQLRFEMESGGASSVELFTDLAGETQTSKGVYALTNGPATRAWATVPLPEGIEARSVRVQVTGDAGYRIYRAQVRSNRIGRFLMGTAPDGLEDAFNTLEFDFQTERFKAYKRLEIDLRAADVVTVEVITSQDGDKLAPVYAPAIYTPNGRETILVPLVPGLRGRLVRVRLSSPSPARVYHLRVWARTLTDPKASWDWLDYPMETSQVVPTWTDIMDSGGADETPSSWEFADIPFEVTEGA